MRKWNLIYANEKVRPCLFRFSLNSQLLNNVMCRSIIRNFCQIEHEMFRSQWPCALRRTSSAARLLRSWVRIPPGAWMSVCCVLSGRGLCDGLITRPEESWRWWRVVVCDKETSKKRKLKPATGLWKIKPQRVVTPGKQTNKQQTGYKMWEVRTEVCLRP
jgi:hypothetical protein